MSFFILNRNASRKFPFHIARRGMSSEFLRCNRFDLITKQHFLVQNLPSATMTLTFRIILPKKEKELTLSASLSLNIALVHASGLNTSNMELALGSE